MIRNTKDSYGSVAKWLHWLTALMFLLAYIFVYYLVWFIDEQDRQSRFFVQSLHKGVGFSVLVFFVLRLYWRFANPQPKHPDNMPWWQVKASQASHFLLYFFMLAMPLSGYLGNGGGVNYGLFQIEGFRRTEIGIWIMDRLNVTWEEWEAPLDYFHYHLAGPYILWVLIAVHIGAALYHHFVYKDDILTRMLPAKKHPTETQQPGSPNET